MISYILENDLIKAYIEWQVVDEKGIQDDYGLYIYIKDLWISPKHRGKKLLNRLIKLIDQDERSKSAVSVYWQRSKYNYRLSKNIPRSGIAKKGV